MSYHSVTLNVSDIVKNWEVAKILVTANAQPNYLAYKLGKKGIYVHNFKTILTDLKKNIEDLPMLLDVRSPDEFYAQEFVLGNTEFKAYKVFKHGDGFKDTEDVVGLAANTMKNLLNMEVFKTPQTFYIDSDSQSLRNMFYNIGVRINTEDECRHNFDFETYDYRLIIKKYNTFNTDTGMKSGFSVFTCLTGMTMPNFWNQSQHSD
jgi:hypothetical protein